MTVIDWQTTKRRLMDGTDAQFKWLPDSPPIDDVIFAALKKVEHVACPYDPYRVEPLLQDIGRLLDRIFSYRKEGYDLDIAATTAALDYKLFMDQLPIQIELEQAIHVGKQREIEREAQAKAASAFEAVSQSHELAAAFKESAAGSRDSNAEAVSGESVRRKLVQEKWRLLEDHQRVLQQRHALEGGSMNFKGRLERLLKLLREDVKDAYLKARAAERGLKHVFGINLSLPPLGKSFLEDFLIWTRQAIRTLEIEQLDNIDFEHIVYLAQPRGDGKPSGVVNDYAQKMASASDGTLEVNLKSYFDSIPLGAHLWTRGVGLSFSHNNPSVPQHRLYRLSAQIFPPPVKDLFSSNQNSTIPRGPILLTNVAITDPNQTVKMHRGPEINNIDPRGSWIIKVNSTLGFPNDGTHTRNQLDTPDIKLHLLLTARPKKSAADWGQIPW